MEKKERRQSMSQGSRSKYPKEWSKWVWSDRHKCYIRDREIARGEYEKQKGEPDGKSIRPRRDSSGEKSLLAITESESSRDNYNVSSVGSQFAAVSLNDPPSRGSAGRRNSTQSSGQLDSNYRIYPERDFKVYRVFKTLWSEPNGNTLRGGTLDSVRIGQFGQKFIDKVRRFVIIDARKGHCLCLPIMTYNNQGTTKRGVQAEDHAVIYTSRPVLLEGENQMTKKPIKVEMYNPRDKLDHASRLNYAKVYTIECNVKVHFIGWIHQNSEWYVTTAYNDTHPPLKQRGVQPPQSPPISHSQPVSAGTAYPQSYSQHENTEDTSRHQSYTYAPPSWQPGATPSPYTFYTPQEVVTSRLDPVRNTAYPRTTPHTDQTTNYSYGGQMSMYPQPETAETCPQHHTSSATHQADSSGGYSGGAATNSYYLPVAASSAHSTMATGQQQQQHQSAGSSHADPGNNNNNTYHYQYQNQNQQQPGYPYNDDDLYNA